MSDNTKFEQLLDLLVNEEKDKAESLFHDIVVEKSKEIYQGLIESDESEKEDEVEETSEKEEDAVEEASEKDDEETTESFDDESVEEVGGDAADDMVSDVEAPGAEEGDMDFDGDGEMDDHEESHDDIEDRVVDLEDALDELKAEFEEMMGDKEGGEGEPEMDMPAADDEESEEAEEESMEAPFEATEEDGEEVEEGAKREKSVGETMREYVEKVSAPNNSEGADNTASPVASKGGKDSGADGKNIAQSGEEKGGKAPAAKDMGKSFENEPGANAGDSFKKASAPKSAE
jgi:D-alanyl-D-alanine carboxypeptidase (penicillin-binding protein 5/6)